MWMPRFLAAWLGLNPDLPFAWEVLHPVHGVEAKNKRRQKVVYDENKVNPVTGAPGQWVLPQNFSSKPPVTVTKG